MVSGLLWAGCAGNGQDVARGIPCEPSKPADAVEAQEILVVLGLDYDEPAGLLAIVDGEDGRIRSLRASALRARWSPDGARVAYIQATNFEALSSVWVVDALKKTHRRVTRDWPSYSTVLEWSRDGERIFFNRGPVMWSTTPGAGDERPILHNVGDLRVAPDGRIAFTRDDAVHLANSDGSGAQRVAQGHSPLWAGNGRTLFFVGAGGTLRAVAARGGEPREVGVATPDDLLDVSPDGCSLLVADARGLAVVSVEDGVSRRLTGNERDDYADWSPDGRRIAFVRADDLWIVDPDGRNARLVREAPDYSVFSSVAWRP